MIESGFLSVKKVPGVTSHDAIFQVKKILKNNRGQIESRQLEKPSQKIQDRPLKSEQAKKDNQTKEGEQEKAGSQTKKGEKIKSGKPKIEKLKIGHSGTLDVPASGVLVLGIGKATRLLKFITALPKKYVAELILGVETDTGDSTGKETARMPVGDFSEEDLSKAAKKFLGEIHQIPPMHSAKKVGGQRLYKLAYEGKTIQREPQVVNIYSIQLGWVDDVSKNGEKNNSGRKIARLEVECSMGTYIRTLGEDIAKELGTVGHIKDLCRLSVGGFRIEDAVNLQDETGELVGAESIVPALISPAVGMAAYPQVVLSDEDVESISNGRAITIPDNVQIPDKEKISISNKKSVSSNENNLDPSNSNTTNLNTSNQNIYVALDNNSQLIAVCKISDNMFHPDVVLS